MLFVQPVKADSTKDPFEMSVQPFSHSKVKGICILSAFIYVRFTHILGRLNN